MVIYKYTGVTNSTAYLATFIFQSEQAKVIPGFHLMFVAVHNEKHLVGGTEMGGSFLRESGSHIPHTFLGYVSSDKSGKYLNRFGNKLL